VAFKDRAIQVKRMLLRTIVASVAQGDLLYVLTYEGDLKTFNVS
jgi:hypothetical protein